MNLISNDRLLLFAVLHVVHLITHHFSYHMYIYFWLKLCSFKIKEPNVPEGTTLVRPVLLL